MSSVADPPGGVPTQLGELGTTSVGADPELTIESDGDGEPRYTVSRPLSAGDVVGRYVITHALGQGGMGVVYAAHDPELDRRVAIKLLLPQARGSLGTSDGQQRLLREARAMARLTHPNVVTVHDVGTFDRAVFVAMEYVEGQTLGAWMAAGKRSWREVLSVFVRAGQGLEAAHDAGLVHRDFKPDNVMIERDGRRVLVMDFGLARAADGEGTAPSELPTESVRVLATGDLSISDKLTRTGAMVGTPAYMAPEQHLGRSATPATDQFAFCVALYEALYGERPFSGDTMAALVCAVTEGEVRSAPAGARVPPWLRRAVLRGLAVAPERRWPSMTPLLGTLRREPGRRRRIALGLAGAIVVGGAATAAAWSLSTDEAQVCAGAEARFDTVWSDDRADALHGAIASAEHGGEDTWARVAAVASGLREEWVAQHVDACEATQVRHVQSQELMDRRVVCLERRLSELDATVGVLTDGGAAASTDAVQAIARIRGRLPECADTERLMAAVAPPEDPDTAAAVEALRARVALAEAQSMTDLKEAAATAQAAVDEAAALGYEPVLAEAQFRRAQIAQDVGDLDETERLLKAAHYTARGARHDRVAAETAAELMTFYAEDRADYDAAEEWREQAEAEARRYGDGTEVQARYLDNLGMLHLRRGDLEKAITEHRRALEIWERIDGPDRLDVAVSEYGLGNALFMHGDVDEAIEKYTRALEIWERELGPMHPLIGDATGALGNCNHRLERYDAAEAFFRRSLDVRVAMFGERHSAVSSALNGIALCHEARGELPEAIATHRRALDIVSEALGGHHPFTASSHNNLGDVLREAGQTQEALAEHRAALEARKETLGEEHPVVSESLTDVALDLVLLGRPKEAIELAEKGLRIREEGGAGPESLAESRFALARALWDSDVDRSRARDLAEKASEAAAKDATIDELKAEIDAWLATHR